LQAFKRPELLKLLGAAYQANRLDWLLMVVALNHGLRVSEVLVITPHDIKGEILTVQRSRARG
jgi:hypothetical protein